MATAGRAKTGRPKAEPRGRKGGPKEAEARARRAITATAQEAAGVEPEVHPAKAQAAATATAPDARTADEILAGRAFKDLQGAEANAWLDATERERRARQVPGEVPFKAAMAKARAKALADQEAALAAKANKGKPPKAPPPEEEVLGPPVLPEASAILAAAAAYRKAADALEAALAIVKVAWDAPWPDAHPDAVGNLVDRMEDLISEDRIGARWTVTDLRELAHDLDGEGGGATEDAGQATWARAILDQGKARPKAGATGADTAPEKAARASKARRVREPGDDDEPVEEPEDERR